MIRGMTGFGRAQGQAAWGAWVWEARSVNGKSVVRALVPQAELARYAIDLRGIGHGSGTFTREFHGYELLPASLLVKYRK